MFHRLLLCFSLTGLVFAQPDSTGLFYALRSELSEDAILVANNGIRVPFGRSVFIDPINDLVIQTQPGDRCSITVLDNDPLSQRPGHLSPKKFPCDFGPNDVTYSHYGSRSPAKDRVRLQLRYDAQTETVIIPFMMEVEVVFTQLELLTKNMPLTVDNLKGTSNPIDKKILEFTYDRDSHKCEGQSRPLFSAHNLEISDEDNLDSVTITVVDGLRHGDLMVLGSHRKFFTPADLTTGVVVYMHDGSDTYSDNIVFKMSDGKNEVEFLFPITIVPTDDEPPIINANTGLVLFKNQMMPISPLMLSAADIDSEDSTIKFTIVPPFSNIGTVFLRQSDAPEDPSSWKFNAEDEVYEKEVTEWLQKDITDGKLFYKHTGPHNTETIMDQFVFTAQDDNDPPNESGENVFIIRVLPIDDVPPELFPGTTLQLTVQEYKLTHFSKEVLRYTDLDSEDRDLKYTVIQPPTDTDENNPVVFGSLVLTDSPDTEVTEFTQAQINHHKISYGPPDVELGITAHVVQFRYTVEDTAGNSVEGAFTIYLQPVNNKPPQITNTGFTVLERGMHIISIAELDTTDVDTASEQITFTLSQLPKHGQLQVAFTDLEKKGVFRLEEISEGKISYIHNGEETMSDEFQLDVSDGIHVVTVTVKVNVRPVDDETPTVSLPAGTIGSHIDVLENGATEITTNVIQGHDDDTDDLQLTFIVEDPPAMGEILVKGVPATRFTQADIINGVVVYAHTGGEIGLASQQDGFNLTLTDMSDDWTVGGNKVNGVHVRVTILPVDSQAPEVGVGIQFSVIEGEKYAIGPQHLNADDNDTPTDDILCTIIVQPTAGYVENISPAPGSEKSRSGTAISAFTIRDIREGNIYYVQSIHKGVEPVEDREIVVMEGMNIVIDTPILNGDDADIPPEELMFIISKPPKHVLRAEDRDSIPASLVFHITTEPRHGYIINLGQGNDSISTFSQADIDDLNICYVLRNDENATSDVFHFSVADSGGNKLKNQQFRLDWAWISLEKEYYVVDEEDKFLEVVLRRRGYLGETSFIGIGTEDGTAKKEEDFKGRSQRQVQFNPGQTTATWRVRILTDGKYEQAETFQILLSEPVMGVMEFPATATVEILDPSDESTVFFPEQIHSVEEDVGELFIPVHRSGDISQELMVVCYTQHGSASGTIPTTVLSYSDYISRPEEHGSILRFDKGEREKQCRVMIIDDSLYEGEENFNVTLSLPVGGRLGLHYPTTKVNILEDMDDAPVFYFGEVEYRVDESDGYVEVKVWRTGTDLSKTGTITVRSRKAEPVSAEAGIDYVGISRNLDFAPGVSMQTFRVTILDDLGQPELEGTESFELVLRMPVDGVLGEPGKATVFINDSISDLPKVQFREPVYTGEESDGQITATVYRSGDIRHKSTVRCYTREAEKPCILSLVDDTLYEEGEELRLVLGYPKSDSQFGASVGALNETLVKIKDTADKPIIRFLGTKFSVSEPKESGAVATVSIPVVRVGDTSKVSVVRVHTKDGSAISGEDYNPVSQDIEFKQGDKEHVVEVEVLFDGVREMREAFTLHLKPDENMVAETQVTKVIVYIEETNSMADVTFPSLPHVVSLLHYDDVARTPENLQPPAGYPVICVTACNTKYPDYDKTGSICVSEHINNTLTRYRWLISAPAGPDGVTSPMREVDFDTFFTSSKMITLDSVYFQAGSRVQCAARAVNSNGDEGLELSSPIVTINKEEGMCQPRKMGTVGAEPFSAKLRYTGADDPKHPNLIKVTVTMPHIDGMLPVVSTRPLMNFELTLSPDGTRVGNHRCSNLLDYQEVTTGHGFITASTRNPESMGDMAPYQFSSSLRGNSTLRFYRNLNLEACLWEFTSYYHMSELLTDCGGTIGTDGQVLNLVQSYVTLRVPLYVSYVFHSPVGTGGWQHFDLQSELRLTFVYDTAILWKDGIGSPPQAELQGALYPTSMRINEQGRLVVNFRTKARFRGLFVESHSGGRIKRAATSMLSMVMSVDHPGLTFNLTLVRSEPTYNQPVQQWTFTSDFAVRDYSGTYTVKLIPCTTAQNMEYTVPPVCSPREPISFDLDIRFQQVSDPVAVEFSLNTQMFLLSKRSLWLSDGSMGFGQESDVAFSEGDTVYGRVMVDPVQNLGDSFYCSIEKVFLCTGADGYVPKYNPTKFEFGCLADSPSLLYRFKIIDKAQPETQARAFGDVAFNALLAVDDPSAMSLVRQPGSDGFRLDSTAMFQVAAGREWYIHTIYTVRSKENANRGIGKRSLEYHSLVSTSNDLALSPSGGKGHRSRRSAPDEIPEVAEDIGADNNRGTNIMHIVLDRAKRRALGSNELLTNGLEPSELNAVEEEEGLVTVVGALVGLLLTVLIIVTIILVLRFRQKDGKEGWREGVQEVVKGSVSTEPMLVVRMQDCHNSSEV
ncbi:FRAS1-related extracellular matrix protein 2 [Nibea albiflora]|uniref:FRAS1-related extracellular matrix protein 2 n=1 Tax=Nibea albiflora TaxID=240163 RepID=A0ACB7F4L8_NIBAL|nr:FRAS1-related extracellular matrix protein 2 [Nibea albiflora]